MKFYMPVKVIEEPECIRSHGRELASYGKKALLITGRHSAKACGALDDVLAALRENGREACCFSETEENPSVETVIRAAAFGLEEKADFVIGIGGGSPMDAAKAVAFMMAQEDLSPARLYDAALPPIALDVIAVPTTCGTGSEVTGVSVLTVHEKQTKISIPHRIWPKLALIDGKYLKAASASLILSTAIDALAHMLESHESVKADESSRAAVLAGLTLWKDCLPVLKGEKEADAQDLARLMRASTFAGMAIAQTGTTIPHALSYILTYDLGIPHGLAAGYFLPGFLNEAPLDRREYLLSRMGFESADSFAAFIEPALAGRPVTSRVLERAYGSVVSNEARMKGCCFDVDAQGLKRICGL